MLIKIVSSLSLLMIALSVTAQEVVVPEKSMRDAWDNSQEQFDSLSPEYDSPLGRDYGYPESGRSDDYEWRREPDRRAPGDRSGDSVPGNQDPDSSQYGSP